MPKSCKCTDGGKQFQTVLTFVNVRQNNVRVLYVRYREKIMYVPYVRLHLDSYMFLKHPLCKQLVDGRPQCKIRKMGGFTYWQTALNT